MSAVELVAAGLGVADQVEPVPAPALAEVRARRAAGRRPSRRRRGAVVGEERVDLVGRRRQAGQVERDPADQRPPVGLGTPAVRPSPPARARMKRSIGRRGPRRVVHRRRRPRASPAATPSARLPRAANVELVRRGQPCAVRRAGPRAPSGRHPPASRSAMTAAGQLALRRHLQVESRVPHGLMSRLFVRLAGDDGRAAVAALEQARAVSRCRPPRPSALAAFAEWQA